MMLFSSLLFACLAIRSLANPVAIPDHPWSAGYCKAPDLEVASVNKYRSGPSLVTGARTRANAGGGGASFTNTYTVSLSKTITFGLGLEGSADFTKILTGGLSIDGSFSITQTSGTSVGVNTICPENNQKNLTITWGLMYYQYNWRVTGRKNFYYAKGDTLGKQGCIGAVADDGVKGWHDYTNSYPATQQGSSSGSDAEVEFQCCTDLYGPQVPGSPQCPNAS